WILLAAIVLLSIRLRAREPLSSPIIGAEDPYRHMERTWDLVQGKGFAEYPPGINLVMLPFTFLGADAFYTVSQYMPLVFGAVMVVGMFFLGRAYIHPSGALVASALVAVLPETIRRTDLLFPTALDLAILPFLFLAILRVSEGSKRALLPAGALAGFVFISHPWVLALLVPPVTVFALVMAWRSRPDLRKPLLGVVGGLVAAALFAAFVWPLKGVIGNNALPQLGAILSGHYTVPQFVDLPAMLTIPALVLAAIGVLFAVRRRDRFSLLALLWTGMLLPLVAVDWLGMWYVPHRTVAYLALGVAMLAAIPVSELLHILKDSRPQAQPSATFGAVALALLVMTPTGLNVDPWYRTFTAAEMQAWHDLGARGTAYLEAGSWEARTGYRAVTGRDANYYPDFFTDEFTRQLEIRNHPGLVVVVDCHTHTEGNLPTEFLSGWKEIGHWGDPSCPKDAQGNLVAGWEAAYVPG
ncbi:MAG: glycosyltransferase family 39 protein, partial [Halobacteriales archaeon]|nr:glycosyltransferase family 39 protein [Halobacteriales archaeon]